MNIEREQKLQIEHGDIIIGRLGRHHTIRQESHQVDDPIFLSYIPFSRIIRLNREAKENRVCRPFSTIYRLLKSDDRLGFGIRLDRLHPDAGSNSHSLGPISVSLLPLSFSEPPGGEDIYDKGMTWVNSYRSLARESFLARTMKTPVDIWDLKVKNLPHIQVRVERMPLNSGHAFVDVVDIIIS
jgi:hypothetical protein